MKTDVSVAIDLMILNDQLNELENVLLQAHETKSLPHGLIQMFASRTVTEHLVNNNYDAAMLSRETFNLDENRSSLKL